LLHVVVPGIGFADFSGRAPGGEREMGMCNMVLRPVTASGQKQTNTIDRLASIGDQGRRAN
jgi:hypothetical protein